MPQGGIVELVGASVGVIVVIVVGAVLSPADVVEIDAAFAPGIGLRTAVLWATGPSTAAAVVLQATAWSMIA